LSKIGRALLSRIFNVCDCDELFLDRNYITELYTCLRLTIYEYELAIRIVVRIEKTQCIYVNAVLI